MNDHLARGARCVLIALTLAGPAAQAQFPGFLQRLVPGVGSLPGMGAPPGMDWAWQLKDARDLKTAGRYAEAAAKYEAVLQTVHSRPMLAQAHPEVNILPEYGEVLFNLGREAEGDEAFERALRFVEPAPHLAMMEADLLSTYARVLHKFGRDKEAATAYERELALFERRPELAGMAVTVLPRYADILLRLERLDDAERALLRAWSLEAEQDAPRGREVTFQQAIKTMRGMGQLSAEMSGSMGGSFLADGPHGDPRPADALSLQPPPTSQPVAMLAHLYALRGAAGDRDKLLRLYEQDFRAYLARNERDKQQLGFAGDLDAESACFHMGAALAAAGWREQANTVFRQALAFNRARLEWIGTHGALLDLQLGGFQRRRMIAAAYAAHALSAPASTEETEVVLAALASTKGLALRYANRRRTLLNTLQDSTVIAARDAVHGLEEGLRRMPTTGEAGLRAYAEFEKAYERAMDPALPALAQAGLGGFFTDGRATLAAARQHVGAAAVVGFYVYEPLEYRRLKLRPARYLRYTVSAQGVTLQDIGDRESIDRLLWAWRGKVDATRLPPAGVPLAKALFANLPVDVSKAERWIVDPDGALALLPFEALPLGGGAVLDTHTVSYTSSLAAFVDTAGAAPASASSEAVVLGDARYASAQQVEAAAGSLARGAGDRRLTDLQLRPLPDTRVEAQVVGVALRRMGASAKVLLGQDATPSALHMVQAPRFVHVASHGLFLAPQLDPSDSSPYRFALVLPGMLAGLALTPDENGPMLWASDLAQMNLRGTSLVVLSACDTGNGLVEVGEGLTSLRRAAEEAGARATLTSLWPVSSRRTTEFMDDFYRGLGAGAAKAAALRSAKLKARASGASVRDWSGFLLAGDGT